MVRIAICDDESISAKKIQEIVKRYMEERQIILYEIDIFSSGENFIKCGAEITKYKIIFLDINMEVLNGIETAKVIRKFSEDIFIVFVTAYINYTLDGYKVEAIRYILKDKNKLIESIYESMDAIFYKMNYVVIKKEIPFIEGKRVISLDYLLYVESKLHKLEFHMIGNGILIYTLYDTLNNIEKEYREYEFIRVHQSFLVNLKHVKAVEKNEVLLTTGMRITIPKVRYKFVQESYIAYRGEI